MLLCWPRQQSSSWEEPGINASLEEGMANEKKNMHRLGTFPSQQLSVSIWECACSQKNLPGVWATKLSHKDIKPYQNQLFDQSKRDDTCWNKWITLKSWFGAQGVDIYMDKPFKPQAALLSVPASSPLPVSAWMRSMSFLARPRFRWNWN